MIECIDVGYVESLMWSLDEKGRAWGWLLFPENLRRLYIEMWGKQPFMQRG